jgi:hypothetical protein
MRAEITLVRFKITVVHIRHIRACQNHNTCGNYTLNVLITLVSVIITRIRAKLLLCE